jgi:hypothetical protein
MKKLNSKRLKKRGTEERWGWGTRTEKNCLRLLSWKNARKTGYKTSRIFIFQKLIVSTIYE